MTLILLCALICFTFSALNLLVTQVRIGGCVLGGILNKYAAAFGAAGGTLCLVLWLVLSMV